MGIYRQLAKPPRRSIRYSLMQRTNLLVAVLILFGFGVCCRRSAPASPLVIHMLRDASAPFADKLRQADLQFGLTRPQLKSGKGVMVATNEGNSFAMLFKRFNDSPPELLILNSQADMPTDPNLRSQLGQPELVCGQHPAFIPTSVSGEPREAAQMYLQFLSSHCEAGR